VVYCADEDEDKIVVVEPGLIKKAGLNIDNLSWVDVHKINAGNEKYGFCSVATLEDVQKVVGDKNIALQIHIKGENSKTVPLLLSKVNHFFDAALTTFDLDVIRSIRKFDETVQVGWIVKPQQEKGSEGVIDLTSQVSANPDSLSDYTDEELADILLQAKQNHVDIVILCGPRVRSKEIVDRVKENGFQVGAWGVAQNLEIARRLVNYGIDRFTIDNPEVLLDQMGSNVVR
jgi:glycerophosphoryl diester phosphodiesterase